MYGCLFRLKSWLGVHCIHLSFSLSLYICTDARKFFTLYSPTHIITGKRDGNGHERIKLICSQLSEQNYSRRMNKPSKNVRKLNFFFKKTKNFVHLLRRSENAIRKNKMIMLCTDVRQLNCHFRTDGWIELCPLSSPYTPRGHDALHFDCECRCVCNVCIY